MKTPSLKQIRNAVDVYVDRFGSDGIQGHRMLMPKKAESYVETLKLTREKLSKSELSRFYYKPKETVFR